ncbi:mitochondria fission 1 protein [Aspergillus novoparasiticus]|uniref:Mitochondrial fission 1 protein n=1 Tax=Aspergillus novoparasiticus TaxID=986946 RepID=A0A5N6EA97_9EURO|nr:mitochondria fission 1 protein [Aspergillus novoparasiticus]
MPTIFDTCGSLLQILFLLIYSFDFGLVKGCLSENMGSNLPYAADAESPLKPAELQVLRAQYEKEGDYVGIQTKFNFAWGLIKSNARPDQQEGVRLLSEIFRAAPERRRECLYYLALGNYKLGNYGEARRYNDLLLEKEPANLQAASLGTLIDERVSKEGLMGFAIVGGLALAAGLVGGMVFRGAKRR